MGHELYSMLERHEIQTIRVSDAVKLSNVILKFMIIHPKTPQCQKCPKTTIAFLLRSLKRMCLSVEDPII